MPEHILFAVISINISLICYLSVYFINRKAKIFTAKQLILLMIGLTTDTIGTAMMRASVKQVTYDFHTISGYLALSLMLVITLHGIFALLRKKHSLLINFGKYYTPLLIIWLSSFVTGVMIGLQRAH